MKHNDIDIDEIIEDAQANLEFNGVYRKREERAAGTRCILIMASIVLFVIILGVCICVCEKVPV